MDLFTHSMEQLLEKEAPLAWRMRPKSLSEFVGQGHILSPGKLLRRLIEADRVQSVILFGKPGIGKTSLANVIAHSTKSAFRTLNAVTSSVKDIREVIETAKETQKLYNKKTLLFVDEIHRFNKAQQDALLPDVEKGIIRLIGATTYNPFFSVIPALVSRSQIFELQPLSIEDIGIVLTRALAVDVVLTRYNPEVADGVLSYFAHYSNGDVRRALNALELATLTTPTIADKRLVTMEIAMESIDKKPVVYDENEHFDVISAFQKSMRGSDVDATLYWMAKMIYAGEDPVYIARRIMVCAAEDVGDADPQALVIATSAFTAAQQIGLPEARIPLALAATYIAKAPKSNAVYCAIDAAISEVSNNPDLSVPAHLRDAHYPGAKSLGYGKDYIYPPSHPGEKIEQSYLPINKKFYFPTK
ncbi:MAG: replication-associated recombination protein A [Candidatus Margulisiibacteriota bacterium]|nr:MAG: AAA family ATPase [Candidatus Margulisbacteria bacterium GWD2_39_127]OGI03902.1 MAG: AAA family ATPase [Candidatus Margulisbacteria bacterium GWF2_38_17]OGI08793.1 MAG: AAA family ATPase [Candidatus Margulisbacteria bacterium GWE2_39_32]PZM78625.1 MAG: replication-associated recombination protein A [Candidatus Margulisiibacteriota bacterium]HAR61965.1 hypothetical protein [Candidatus Margulisiibacteriota bacterium]